jgi:hypothetical protein
MKLRELRGRAFCRIPSVVTLTSRPILNIAYGECPVRDQLRSKVTHEDTLLVKRLSDNDINGDHHHCSVLGESGQQD